MITSAHRRDRIALALAPAVNQIVEIPTRRGLSIIGSIFGGAGITFDVLGMRWLFHLLVNSRRFYFGGKLSDSIRL